jgi:putative flippase GtrA
MTASAVPTAAGAGRSLRPLLGRAGRFLTGGVAVLPFSFALYLLAVHAGTGTTPARALAFAAGTAAMYVVHRRWSFRARGGPNVAAAFAVLYLVTFAVAVAVNAAVLDLLPNRAWAVPAGWFVSQAAATALNFCGLQRAVFRNTTHPRRAFHQPESRKRCPSSRSRRPRT